MPRTRIILGYDGPGSSARSKLVYQGTSGADAQAAMQTDTLSARFEIFEGMGRRKNNPNFRPVSQVAEAEAAAKPEAEAAKVKRK